MSSSTILIHMRVVISLFRGINVGGHHRVKMDALRALYGSLGLQDAQTYVQSGNVVFRTKARDEEKLAQTIEKGFEAEFGFHSDVITRTRAEMEAVVLANPFKERDNILPSRLAVTFLQRDPGDDARDAVSQIKTDPEEMRVVGRELYVYYPEGMGRTKLPVRAIDKALGVTGTVRNWNSVTELLAMAKAMEES